MDPANPIDSMQFPVCNQSEFYGEVLQLILLNIPKAIGKAVDLHMFIGLIIQGINAYIDPKLVS